MVIFLSAGMAEAVQDGVFRSKRLVRALEAGDKVAEEAVDRACHWLAVAAGNLINTISPDLVLFGGGVIEALGDLFLGKILKRSVERKLEMLGQCRQNTV